MAKSQASWKSALTPQKAPTYGNQGMLIASPKELQVSNIDYVVVFEGTKKYHVAIADVVNPYTLHVVIPEHDTAEDVAVKVFMCEDSNVNILTHLKFTYITQMEHAIARFLALSVSDCEVAEKLDAVWTVCLGKEHSELWDKRLAQAFAQLELPIEWTLVGDILQKEDECQETLLHFAAQHGLKELMNVFLNLPGAKQALSTWNKSGLLPRDVARESGRLDMVELLDADRNAEHRKSGTFKDNSRRKVKRNNDNGVTTITNLKNHSIQDDIQFLRELNKLKSMTNSPVNRHSWPVDIQSFHPDEDYIDDLELELSNTHKNDEQISAKRPFLDDNLIRLREITEGICNLRSQKAEEALKEISIIAERNRRPAHSRRLSCPASVERRKRASKDFLNLKSRPGSSTSDRTPTNQVEPPTNPASSEPVFFTPPDSPPVGHLIDLTSPTVTSPSSEATFPIEPFMTPASSTPSFPQQPVSPAPISLKYSDVAKRPNTGRKDRPRTWYGGKADIASAENENLFRRSNSLEDFAKALADVSDDESLASAASGANSREGLLQTLTSLTEKESRTESFVSSISDGSVDKESVGSDVESEHGDDCEHECTHGDNEGVTVEKDKDISGCEEIPESKPTGALEGIEDETSETAQDIEEHKETNDVGISGDDIEAQPETSENNDSEKPGEVEGENIVGSGDSNEYEEIKMKEDVSQIGGDIAITAGSNVENGDLDYVENDAEHERKNFDHEQESENKEEECSDTVTECESGDVKVECGDVKVECGDVKVEYGDVEFEYGETVNETEDVNNQTTSDNEEEKVNQECKREDSQNQEGQPRSFEDQQDIEINCEENAINPNEEKDDESCNTEGGTAGETNQEDEGNKELESTPNYRNDDQDIKSHMDDDGSHNDLADPKVAQDLVEQEGIVEHQIPDENVGSETSSGDVLDKESLSNEETFDVPEVAENAPKGDEDLQEKSLPSAESDDRVATESETQSGDPPTDSGQSEDFPAEPGDQTNFVETVAEDVEDPKIQFKDLNDIECEVKDFCLPGQNNERNKELFRVQATDDVESGEDSDPGKHIQFDEKEQAISPMAEERSPRSPRNSFGHEQFRQRSALLLSVKAPVKRTGSDISVTSLQDVQLDMNASKRDGDLSPLNSSRKAKSFGDLSTFKEVQPEIAKDDGNDSDEERRRIQEDHTVLSRVKKFEQVSKYASNEHLEQISNSQVITDREDEKQGNRRWSNFFYTKNPKAGKKPGRTPTFKRDGLRSSMTSIGKGSKSGGKSTIETLVTGQHSAAFAKHSQTAPNLQVATNRPRSYTKDSPGPLRKSPTVGSSDFDEQKAESPDEVEIPNEDMDLDVDSDLENFDKEPEAWSVTVDKKILKKMSKNDIKRQDVILELIQTEGHHLRTLKIMQQVFYRGLNKFASFQADRLDELFPRINELVEISARFYMNLRCRQDEAAAIQKIGDAIVKQFGGDNGILVKQAYGEFVSKHPEAVALYKQYFKTDKKFSNFIKKCTGHRIVRRLSVPECFTLVTQRMTKYPILVEAILKATKSSHPDYLDLRKASLLVKDATKSVDNAIKDYEKQTRLRDIKMRMDKGSVVLKGGQKIKNSRFVDYQSKMVHDGVLQWKNARGKLTETHVVLLESMVAFLQENDKKFSLLSIDGKSPCIALRSLMVREVATDKCAIYFVSTSKKGPDMYEFVCSSQKEKKNWCTTITDAIAIAPEDTGELFHSPEEEKKLAEERLKRRNELLEYMKIKDGELSELVEEKNKLVIEMKDLYQIHEGNGKTKDQRIASNERARSILLSAIKRTTQLTADTVLIHESHSDSELAAATNDKKPSSPKRWETFGGFDRRPSQKTTRRATTTIPEGKLEENSVAQRRDSGLSLASESAVGSGNELSHAQEMGSNSSFEVLDALQWVLREFSIQETKLEMLQMNQQAMTEEMKKLRLQKLESDKKGLLMKEEHQAELTRQKKAYSELERTFNTQVSSLKQELSSQQAQHAELLKDFSELRSALRRT